MKPRHHWVLLDLLRVQLYVALVQAVYGKTNLVFGASRYCGLYKVTDGFSLVYTEFQQDVATCFHAMVRIVSADDGVVFGRCC